MKLNLDEFWSYLQSVFKQIEKGTKYKYRLSPKTVIDELKITVDEMIDLNLRGAVRQTSPRSVFI